MDLFGLFGAALAGAALLVAGVNALLLPRLAPVLDELCGTRERGAFWTTLSGISLTVAGLLAGMLGFLWGESRHPEGGLAAASLLTCTAGALCAGLGVIGAVVQQFT